MCIYIICSPVTYLIIYDIFSVLISEIFKLTKHVAFSLAYIEHSPITPPLLMFIPNICFTFNCSTTWITLIKFIISPFPRKCSTLFPYFLIFTTGRHFLQERINLQTDNRGVLYFH